MTQQRTLERAIAHKEVHAGGHRLELAWRGPMPDPNRTTTRALVFLHEGLGCIEMWRDFPERVSARLGLGALLYSRAGYGGSDPVALPRPLDYMQREGTDTLPTLLETLEIDEAILVGHSDGGSIALVSAGIGRSQGRIRALVLEAPHVFCEELSVTSIEKARLAFDAGVLRKGLERYHHANVDCAFRGWNEAWLDPRFKDWNIESFVREVRIPTLVIQGEDDAYGTLRQVEAIEHGALGSVERLILPGVGHSPHRDAPLAVLDAIEAFVRKVR